MFISTSIKSKNFKKCAFCKHWYDPTNQFIRPKYPNNGIWEYDSNATAQCLKSNLKRRAYGSCNQYDCKLI